MTFLEIVSQLLLKFDHLGHMQLENGTYLTGHVPCRAPLAYLHHVYPAAEDWQVKVISSYFGTTIPTEYLQFLKHHNGINLFLGELCVFGFSPEMVSRKPPEAFYYPFSLVSANEEMRKLGFQETDFVFGSQNGQRLIYDLLDGYCYKVIDRKKAMLLHGIDETLCNIISDATSHYDQKTGKKIIELH